jgi:hypothetical protein
MTLETWLEIARANLATRADPIRFGEREIGKALAKQLSQKFNLPIAVFIEL